MSSNAHVPVLLGPVLEGLEIKQDGCYVDGTFGRGGHSRAILERLNASGKLIAIDRDPQAIASAAPSLTSDPRIEFVRSDFAELATCLGERGIEGQVDGLLFDLGVSSPQLDEADTGLQLSPRRTARHAHGSGFRRLCSRLAAIRGRKDLEAECSIKYGEERDAPRIARAIVDGA